MSDLVLPQPNEPLVYADRRIGPVWLSRLRDLVDLVNRPVDPSYTVATLPTDAMVGARAFVTDETGGAVPAFFDGTNWRRVTDRAIVS